MVVARWQISLSMALIATAPVAISTTTAADGSAAAPLAAASPATALLPPIFRHIICKAPILA